MVVRRYMMVRMLEDDGETFRDTHCRVVEASDHDALLAERDQEIERLKSLDDTAMRLVLCHDERDALRAENARLNERLDDALGDYMPVVTERDSLRAENARLREALVRLTLEKDDGSGGNFAQKIAPHWVQSFARAALALGERKQEGET
jgi:hypothetical protein